MDGYGLYAEHNCHQLYAYNHMKYVGERSVCDREMVHPMYAQHTGITSMTSSGDKIGKFCL